MPLSDRTCLELLRWAGPRLGLRPEGFRRVRGQVCKRLGRRMAELGLDEAAYRARLEADPAELAAFDAACRVTIARFYRDRAVWDALGGLLVPLAARAAKERRPLRALSAGACGGEEPYTLALVLRRVVGPRVPGLSYEILAVDDDEPSLARAREGCYPAGNLRELPAALLDAFEPRDGRLCLRPEAREGVRFERHDLRVWLPDGPFELVLCRNTAFTYFAAETHPAYAAELRDRLVPGGLLAVGAHERLPETPGLVRVRALPLFVREGA